MVSANVTWLKWLICFGSEHYSFLVKSDFLVVFHKLLKDSDLLKPNKLFEKKSVLISLRYIKVRIKLIISSKEDNIFTFLEENQSSLLSRYNKENMLQHFDRKHYQLIKQR